MFTQEAWFSKGHLFQGRDYAEQGGNRLLFGGEVGSLMHLWKKPGSPKDISSKDEILQSKGMADCCLMKKSEH
eukprot:8209984-Ditylum_brightwellii.AAC.1